LRVLWRILSYVGIYKWQLVLAYTTMFIGLAALLAVPRLVEYVIDDGIDAGNRRVVLLGSLAIVGAAVGQGIFIYIRSYLFQALAERVSTDMRAEYYRKLQTLSFSFYDTADSGQLMARGAEDINSIRRFLMFSMRMFIYGLTMIVAVSIILLRADGSLALMALAVIPILVFTSVRFGRIVRPQFLNVQQQFGDMSSVLQENLAGTRVVRVFAAEQREIKKYDQSLQDLFDWQMSAVRIWSKYFPAMTMLNELAIGFILWYGGRQVLSGQLSIGTLIAFNLYMVLLMMPVRSLGFIINSLARAIASGERIFEILDVRPPIRDKDGALELANPRGAVRFEDVSFRFPNSEPLVLRDIDIEAAPGKIVALFGPTGSGKSTVTALLQRSYDVTEGRVSVDSHDVRDLTLTSLRRSIGVVAQDTFLFGTSIRDNIAFGNPDASDAQIERAARIAKAHDFIMQQPQGYDTVIGERGVSLSGGQKQRVSLARALCTDPAILILDDATSSVDTETEYEIQQALRDAMEGRTTFVIAQRLSTLKHADEIIVLEHGQVAERGRHDELLRNRGLYARIYDLQLRDQEELLDVAD